MSCHVSSCLVLSCLVMSCHVLSCLVLSCLVWSCLVLSCLVLSFLILSFFLLYLFLILPRPLPPFWSTHTNLRLTLCCTLLPPFCLATCSLSYAVRLFLLLPICLVQFVSVCALSALLCLVLSCLDLTPRVSFLFCPALSCRTLSSLTLSFFFGLAVLACVHHVVYFSSKLSPISTLQAWRI